MATEKRGAKHAETRQFRKRGNYKCSMRKVLGFYNGAHQRRSTHTHSRNKRSKEANSEGEEERKVASQRGVTRTFLHLHGKVLSVVTVGIRASRLQTIRERRKQSGSVSERHGCFTEVPLSMRSPLSFHHGHAAPYHLVGEGITHSASCSY